jgi:hypothetical protein
MCVAIDRLKQITERCLAGEALDPDLADWLGHSLEGYLRRRYRTVEEALGLHFPQGGVPWWREEAIRTRDAALRELAGRFFPDLSAGARAQRIFTMARRYAASAWRHDRENGEMPAHYRGTAKECLWRAFASGATMP